MTRHYFRQFVFYPFAALIGLITLIWLATPFVAEHYLSRYMSEQGQRLSIGTLSVDFFPPRIDLKNLTINNEKQDTLTLKRALFEVELWPLFTKKLSISDAKIDGLTLQVTQQENDWIIAGVNTTQYLTDTSTDKPDADSKEVELKVPLESAWTISLPVFTFTNSQVNVSQQPDLTLPAMQDTLRVAELTVNDLFGQALTWQGDLSLSALINSTKVSIRSQFDYSPEQAQASVNIDNTRLWLEDFRHFIPAPFNQSKGQVDLTSNLQVLQTSMNGATSLNVKKLNLQVQGEDLTLFTDQQSQASTQSTSFHVQDSELTFASPTQFSVKGAFDLQASHASFTQKNQTLKFALLTLGSPLHIEQNGEKLTASGMLNIVSEQLHFRQAEQTVEYDELALTLPFDVLQNENDIAANGRLNVSMLKPQFAQDEQKAQFDTVTLVTPFDIKQNNANLSISGELKATSSNALLNQGNQTMQFDALSLWSPFKVSRDPTDLSAKTLSTQLDVHGLSVALDDLALHNEHLALTLSDVDATLHTPQDLDTLDTTPSALTAVVTAAINSQDLSIQQAGNQAHYDALSFSNTLLLQKKGNTLTAENRQLTLDIQGLSAEQADGTQISLTAANLNADLLTVQLEGEQEPSIEAANLNLSSESLDSILNHNKRLASWEEVELSGVSFRQQGKHYDVSLAQLSLQDLVLSQQIADDNNQTPLPALSHIGALNIEQLKANQEGAEIHRITADTFNVNVILDAQKRLENLVFIDAEQQAASTPKSQDTLPKANVDIDVDVEQQNAFKVPYYLIIDRYDTTGKSTFYVQDNRISPALQRSVDIEILSLRHLNTQKKDQQTLVTLKARNDKYAILEGDVTIQPLADRLTLNSQFRVREAELPPFSSYIASVLGYQIDSGQLDLDLTLHANEGVLDGSSHIVLREFDLGGRQDSSSVIKAGAVPLNIAVGILKDSNNTIELDIPFSGDIDNPEFGWRDFLFLPVKKALYTASSSYLMQTFIPYANVISIAQFAGDQLLKIRVEPLLFDVGDENLNERQTPFLSQLAALMKDKEDSQLKACGVASYLDLALENPPATLNNTQQETAKALAQARANHLKDYLVKEGIPSSRVFVCSPEVDLGKNSPPRIELNF
ncbi:DUF748 domain-containing protein [Marinomonas sp. IMCC 4694]|uniref:DUF748 domain-containing protein n=1 Tax=Marinomonas sp. IMCC 4694 TaxID=2605432 RepID=UPI0011E7B5CD|nr:DUF748 domain-containing protein [Marinomonas sp. IMCC 4694]TYL47414.1 DUF748 domain-containing protein [Marinomonas sp. IMCC 4694]